ncbi:MAG TPA: phosphate ABC transporter substrate-binding protein PstS [Victivallales bacterium]|nr:phosphate ABC transporter substrate-binding protein PstS [Victivallales bacterium]
MSKKSLLKSIVLALGICGLSTLGLANIKSITGAGSTFVYPVLSQWAVTYHKKTGIAINYQPIGSGGGLRQLNNKTVNFAASDKPLTKQQLDEKGLIQFPVIVGGIVPIVHVQGLKANQLLLNGKVLADIYLGKVKYWNDPAIQKLNPGLTLPHTVIVPVRRADGSGTTYNFTNYLSKVSPVWKSKVGFSTDVQWPSMALGAKGNAGVAAQVQTIPNTIGYVEYAYAIQNKLTTVKMVNADGKTVVASLDSFKAAASNAKWSSDKGFYMILTNAPGKNSWPIAASTFVLLYKKELKNDTGKAIVKFFKWVYSDGGEFATKLDYVAIPKNVNSIVEHMW